MARDFTYIDDVVEIIKILVEKPALSNSEFDRYTPDPSSSWAPHKILNIGNGEKVNLMKFINLIEKELGINAVKNYITMQRGDVEETFADTKELIKWTNYQPKISIEEGVKKFISWYKKFYKI